MQLGIPFLIVLGLLTSVTAKEPEKKPEKKSSARVVLVQEGFGTGNTYQQMSEEEKVGYASGFLDGLLCAPFFNSSSKEMEWLLKFSTGKSNIQVAAILSKFLSQNPEKWDQPLNILAYQAFRNASSSSSASTKVSKD